MTVRPSPTDTIALALILLLALTGGPTAYAQEIQFPLTVTTDNGGSQELTLGLDPSATDGIDPALGETEGGLPPPPPGFYARLVDDDVPASGFGEGLHIDIRQGGTEFVGTKKHQIRFRAEDAATNVTISWDLPDGITGTINDKFGGGEYSMDMSGTGSITVDPGAPDAIVTLEYNYQTAIVGDDGTGNDTGWRLLATPSSATRGDLEDDLDFNVDSGHLLHTWDGTQWVGATSASTPLPRGKGFILYFFDDSTDPITSGGLPIDVPDAGEDPNAPVTVDGLSQSSGTHLLGNPYDVAFDLGALAGGDLPRSGFQGTVQVWDPSGGGQWTTITQGTTNDNIAAWQGFFVERTQTGSGKTSLTFDADGRQSGPGDLIGSDDSPSPQSSSTQLAQVEVALTVANSADTVAQGEATVLFHEEAQANWDVYEASQLPPPNAETYATVNSPLQRSGPSALVRRTLASEPFPTKNAPNTIPLSVRSVDLTGTATLRWPPATRDAFPADWGVELVDTVRDSTVNLRQTPYTFTLSEGDGVIDAPDDARFDLRVTPTTLPVELAQFDAQHANESVRLQWRTASETDNVGFYVQRRQDRGPWRRLGFVASTAQEGTASTSQSYQFTDADLPFAANRLTYRLRQVAPNGAARVSATTVVQLNTPDQLTLRPPFPNPVPQQADLQFGLPAPATVRIEVFDLLGRQVSTVVSGRFQAGRHTEQFSVSSLAPGTYFVRMRVGTKTRTQKLSVVR